MARPIEPTPTLDGEDADRLLESFDKHASSAEMEERQRRAKEYLEDVATLNKLTAEAQKLGLGEKYTDALKKIVAERKPLPPEVLADAMQDR